MHEPKAESGSPLPVSTQPCCIKPAQNTPSTEPLRIQNILKLHCGVPRESVLKQKKNLANAICLPKSRNAPLNVEWGVTGL